MTQTVFPSHERLSEEEEKVSFVGVHLAERGHEEPSDTLLSKEREILQKTTPDVPPTD